MPKIGTAHIEIKPVLNEEAMAEVNARIDAFAARLEEAVRKGVEAGMAAAHPPMRVVYDFEGRPVLDITSIRANVDGAR